MDRMLSVALAALLVLAACQKAPATANAVPTLAVAAAPRSPATIVAPAAPASDADDVKAFLAGLYAHYQSSKAPLFDPYDADAARVFDRDTLALLKAEKAAMKGEVGALDADSICMCQDFGSLRATITVTSTTATTATANADLRDVGFKDDSARRNTFDLVKTPAGWRVHDIHSKDQASFRQSLSDDIKGAKSGAAT